jgi:hypothetical protein
VLTIFAAALGIIETLRSLARYLRAPSAEAPRAAALPAAPKLTRPPEADPALRV